MMASGSPAAADRPDNSESLASDKARRIVEAMRVCISKYGPVNATFDVVAKEAGVSRGLLHYYFGSKERLMIEVLRVEALERCEALRAMAPSITTAEQLMDLLVGQMQEWLDHNPDSYVLVYEMLVEARRNEDIGDAYREMRRVIEIEVATLLERLEEEGAIKPRGGPMACGLALFAIAHGLAMELLANREADHDGSQQCAAEAGLFLLGKETDNYVLPRLRNAHN
jgi:AcrR family transcriptional regulator